MVFGRWPQTKIIANHCSFFLTSGFSFINGVPAFFVPLILVFEVKGLTIVVLLQFIEEEDPDEVAKVKAVTQGRMMMVDVGYDSDSDSDDELLYTTESSSDSNESSDDPNYGSGKRDGIWSKRGNKAKKRKMKKMRKLKLLTRQVKLKPLLLIRQPQLTKPLALQVELCSLLQCLNAQNFVHVPSRMDILCCDRGSLSILRRNMSK